MKTIEQTALEAGLNKSKVLSFVRETYPSATLQTPLTQDALKKLIVIHKKNIPSVKTEVDPATLSTPNQTTTDAALVIDREQQFNFSTRGDTMTTHDTEQKARQAWESDLNLQADFGGDFNAYLAFYKAEKAAKNKSGNAHA